MEMPISPLTDAYQICCGGRRVSYSVFQEDLREQLRLKKLSREGNRLYLGRTLRYESDASERLALLLADQTVADARIPDKIQVGSVTLSEEPAGGSQTGPVQPPVHHSGRSRQR